MTRLLLAYDHTMENFLRDGKVSVIGIPGPIGREGGHQTRDCPTDQHKKPLINRSKHSPGQHMLRGHTCEIVWGRGVGLLPLGGQFALGDVSANIDKSLDYQQVGRSEAGMGLVSFTNPV